MYPAETSLIPVTVSLVKLLEVDGINSFFGWYKYWYLGVPFKYLIGPVFPIMALLLHKVFPVNIFSLIIFVTIFSDVLGAIGWGLTAKVISRSKRVGFLTFILLIVFPWITFSSLTLSEPSLVFAKNLLPFVLLSYWSYLEDSKKLYIPVLATLLIFLVNTQVIPSLSVGIISISIAASYIKIKGKEKGKFVGVLNKLRKVIIIILISFLISSFWYGINYWLTLLSNPSLGGASLFTVIVRIFDLLREGLPFILAFLTVFFWKRFKRKYQIFTYSWLFAFSFLTLFRFISNIAFWQDWSSWLWEAEVGIALLVAESFQHPNSKRINAKYYILCTIFFLLPFYFTWRIYIELGKPALISREIPRGIANMQKLSEIAGNNRVFLSGSDVFWADALYDIRQVRGGNDSVAVNPVWPMAAYQIREGDNPEITKDWLNILGVKYVMVHAELSRNFYHDFKNLAKWDWVGEKIFEERGDIIYKLNSTSDAWVANYDALKKVQRPRSGIDSTILEGYLNLRQKSLSLEYSSQNKVVIKIDGFIPRQDAIVISETYSSGWEAPLGIRISSDAFGNIFLYSDNGFQPGDLTLKYNLR